MCLPFKLRIISFMPASLICLWMVVWMLLSHEYDWMRTLLRDYTRAAIFFLWWENWHLSEISFLPLPHFQVFWMKDGTLNGFLDSLVCSLQRTWRGLRSECIPFKQTYFTGSKWWIFRRSNNEIEPELCPSTRILKPDLRLPCLL